MTRRRLPIIASVIVALAMATMVALGVWQLARAQQKNAAIAQFEANMALPPTAYPAMNATEADYLFRVVSATCLRVVTWQEIGGKASNGAKGWRHIARCATGAEGPGIIVDMGVSPKPGFKPDWTGGLVRGVATTEPDRHSLLSRMTGQAPALQIMIVAETAAPGLVPSARPDPQSVPNNHLAYAVQWFFFAAVAGIIYALAVRARWRKRDESASQ